jgi:hypothetical protein
MAENEKKAHALFLNSHSHTHTYIQTQRCDSEFNFHRETRCGSCVAGTSPQLTINDIDWVCVYVCDCNSKSFILFAAAESEDFWIYGNLCNTLSLSLHVKNLILYVCWNQFKGLCYYSLKSEWEKGQLNSWSKFMRFTHKMIYLQS